LQKLKLIAENDNEKISKLLNQLDYFEGFYDDSCILMSSVSEEEIVICFLDEVNK